MKASQQRKIDKLRREKRFMEDNVDDFPAGSPGNLVAVEKNEILQAAESYAAQQISGADTARQHHGIKDEYLDDLDEMIHDINTAANAFGDAEPGIELKFRLPRNRSAENIVATAQSFLADARQYETQFVKYLGADFLDDLEETLAKYRSHDSEADSAAGSKSAATGGLTDILRRGMINSRKNDAIVRLKYRANPSILAAWAVASHLERNPKRKKDAAKPTK